MVGIFSQEGKEIKFFGCEIFFLSVYHNTSGRFINAYTADFHNIIGLGLGTNQTVVSRHMGFYSGHQFAGAERLGNIVVGAQPQASDFVNVFFFGGNHQHGYIFCLPDFSAYFKAVNAREHQIQNNQVEVFCKRSGKSGIPRIFNIHFKFAQFQIVLFQVGNRFFIFND